VTYLPGVQIRPTLWRRLRRTRATRCSDGRNLKPTCPPPSGQTLPEIAETPALLGPYMVTEWSKGQSLVLEANPYYCR
jgi:hypothetical protein